MYGIQMPRAKRFTILISITCATVFRIFSVVSGTEFVKIAKGECGSVNVTNDLLYILHIFVYLHNK